MRNMHTTFPVTPNRMRIPHKRANPFCGFAIEKEAFHDFRTFFQTVHCVCFNFTYQMKLQQMCYLLRFVSLNLFSKTQFDQKSC